MRLVLACAAAAAAADLGPCGARGRYGEAPNETLFYLKTIKTASSSLRFLFLRFARAERLAALRGRRAGGQFFDAATAKGDTRWPAEFEDPGESRSPPGAFDVAFDHSTWDAAALDRYLPRARKFASSRDVVARAVSAIAYFHRDATPDEYFGGCRIVEGGLCGGWSRLQHAEKDAVHVWNSVAWQLRARAAARPLDFRRPAAEAARLAAADVSEAVGAVRGAVFDFVVVAERYDASLVLLRSKLCWRWLDVVGPEPPLAPAPQDASRRASHRAAAPLRNVTARTLVALNVLDGRIHAAARDAFDAARRAYGGNFDRDVAFFRAYKFALLVTCVVCRARLPPRALAAYADACGDLRPTCRDLAAHESRIPTETDVAARRSRDARAEAALVALVAGCPVPLATAEVCPAGDRSLCRAGPLCLARCAPPRGRLGALWARHVLRLDERDCAGAILV